MSVVDVTVDCPVFDSFRVQQVAGMFDVPLAERASERFKVDIPESGDEWRIGLIVGPSGSGKSTIARRMFADRLYQHRPWPRDKAVVDGMGELPIKTITGLFTAVGFSSPPSWVKPYHVLSGGEQFRCDLARALADAKGSGPCFRSTVGEHRNVDQPKNGPDPGLPDTEPGAKGSGPCFRLTTDEHRNVDRPKNGPVPWPIVAFDEFTSVVDRNVARVASAAIAKAVRGGRIARRFVAVTCHYDVTEWLTPDWVVDMASSTFQWRCLRRPKIELEVFRCGRRAWSLFARHHYLSGSLSRAARCFLATWDGVPVAFCATVSLIGRKHRWRISRVVTLPDYQGVGIGMRLTRTVAELHRAEGHRVNLTASHPAVIAHCRASPDWRAVGVKRTGSQRRQRFAGGYGGSPGRAVVSFEYVAGGVRGQG